MSYRNRSHTYESDNMITLIGIWGLLAGSEFPNAEYLKMTLK